MKKTNKLFELIHSLSKTEKGYFKKYTLNHAGSKEKKYIQLFNAFASQKEYNEKKIKQSLGRNNLVKHFSASQGYLYNIILKSMRAYHGDRQVENKILEWIQNAYFLKNRGLIAQSAKMLEAARDSAEKTDDLITLLKIYDFQRDNYYRNLILSGVTIEKLYSLISSTSEKLTEKLAVDMARTQAHELYIRYGEDTSDAEGIRLAEAQLKNPILHQKKYAVETIYRQVLNTRMFLCFVLGDFNTLKDINDAHLSSIEKDPLFNTETVTYVYGLSLVNQIGVCTRLGMKAEVEELYRKVVALKIRSIQRQTYLAGYFYAAALMACCEFGWEEKGKALIAEIQKMKKLERILSAEKILLLQNNMIAFLFSAADYNAALKIVNLALAHPDQNMRPDILKDIKTMQLLMHYDLKNFQLLESLIASFNRFLVRTNSLDAATRIVFRYLRKLIVGRGGQDDREILLEFKKELLPLQAAERDKRTYLVPWIEKKLSR